LSKDQFGGQSNLVRETKFVKGLFLVVTTSRIWWNGDTMKTQIDIKSALCGIVVGVLAVLAIGAGTSSNEVGRYQISGGENYSVMVDTKTGQAWGIMRCSSKIEGATYSIQSDTNFFAPKP
jgi:hypothetical protein